MSTELTRRRSVQVGEASICGSNSHDLNIAIISVLTGVPEYLLITGVDQCIQKFLDVARQIECFFLQKRFQLSVQKPEQVVKEVNHAAALTASQVVTCVGELAELRL